jgi:FrmR/RcnR family transcriptional regulator, repressor of frmRAB operon
MELRPEEDDPEEQCQNADALSLGLHVVTKTKLRGEWLWGQARKPCLCLGLHTILEYGIKGFMAHTARDKEKLLVRVRRIRGQVEAIERTLDGEHECADVLQLVAACRGALNGLMAELVEGHIWFHVLDQNRGKDSPQAAAAEELIDIVKAYLK